MIASEKGTPMDANDVADYLQQHSEFFAEYADLLAEIYVPHPHGGHAIPIAERQIVTLREKNGQLETKLRELIQFGGENDSISEKLHRSTLALFSATDLETTLGVLYHSLKDDFHVAHVALRLWGKVPEQSYLPGARGDQPGVARLCGGAGRTVLRSAGAFRIAGLVRRRAVLDVLCLSASAHASDVWIARPRRGRSGAVPCRDGDDVSDAPVRGRKRRDRPLPAADLATDAPFV